MLWYDVMEFLKPYHMMYVCIIKDKASIVQEIKPSISHRFSTGNSM